MKPIAVPFRLFLAALGLSLAATACVTTPVTGRSAFNLFPKEQDIALGFQAYQEVLKDSKTITSGPQKDMVVRVMQRLTAVADDPGFEWEVQLIDDPKTVNAFCLPGGKMAVYTGILPVAQDEAGLAVVMGHEIGHAVARHGTERMSIEMMSESALGLALQKQKDDVQALAYIGKELLVSLPWGRNQELEADHIGLIYMARAGYDPHSAVGFWQRMSQLGSGAGWEFLSTHPSDEQRIKQIQKLLPEALEQLPKGSAANPPAAPNKPPEGFKKKS